MSDSNVSYQVQDWLGYIIFECDNLCVAEDFKYSLSDDDSVLEDYWIIGIDENGNEFPPQF